jgi:thymidylate kinase
VIELVGIVPVVISQVYLPLLFGRVVVAERFVVDSIASIAYFLGRNDFAESWQAHFLLGLVPNGTVFVYVDADYDTISRRRGSVAGPRSYTDFHRCLYSELARRVGAFYVDASKNSVETARSKISVFVSVRRE